MRWGGIALSPRTGEQPGEAGRCSTLFETERQAAVVNAASVKRTSARNPRSA